MTQHPRTGKQSRQPEFPPVPPPDEILDRLPELEEAVNAMSVRDRNRRLNGRITPSQAKRRAEVEREIEELGPISVESLREFAYDDDGNLIEVKPAR